MQTEEGGYDGAPARSSEAAATAMWVVPQVAALCASAFRVPLTAGFAQPAESVALGLMLSVQVIAAAALFPVMLADMRRLVMAVVIAWGFGGLAWFMAAAPTVPSLTAMAHVTLWLAALWSWTKPVGRRRTMGLGVAVAMLLTTGGAIAAYLHAEYQPLAETPVIGRWWDWTPLLTTLSQANQDSLCWAGWTVTAVILVGGLALRAFRRQG